MDVHWLADSKPHHFHPRFMKQGLISPMIGDPAHVIPILCDLILSSELKKSEVRF